VFDDVLRDEPEPLLGAHDGLKLRPLALELLLALDLLALGRLLEVRVDLWPLGCAERQLSEAAFVVYSQRRIVRLFEHLLVQSGTHPIR
jgi:hypothetical protein